MLQTLIWVCHGPKGHADILLVGHRPPVSGLKKARCRLVADAYHYPSDETDATGAVGGEVCGRSHRRHCIARTMGVTEALPDFLPFTHEQDHA